MKWQLGGMDQISFKNMNGLFEAPKPKKSESLKPTNEESLKPGHQETLSFSGKGSPTIRKYFGIAQMVCGSSSVNINHYCGT